MFLDVRHDIYDVIDRTILSTHWVLKWCEGDCTAVEGQALKRGPLLFLVTTKVSVLTGCEVPSVFLSTLLTHAAAAGGACCAGAAAVAAATAAAAACAAAAARGRSCCWLMLVLAAGEEA